jgi:hypothetical protein
MNSIAKEQMIFEPLPPFAVSLHISPPTCSISGNPPFTTSTTYKCTASRPMWARISLFNDFGHHIVRDPNFGVGGMYPTPNRKIGYATTNMEDEFDQKALERKDAELVRLNLAGDSRASTLLL